jgi:hypothetical protein
MSISISIKHLICYIKGDEKNLPDEDILKRVEDLALPFLSLHKGMGQVISCGKMGAHLITVASRLEVNTSSAIKVTEIVLFIAGRYFFFKATELIKTAKDLIDSLNKCKKHLSDEEYLKLSKEVMMIVSHILYAASITTGGSELTCARLALKALLCVVEAAYEGRQDGHSLDAIVKCGLAMVNLTQLRMERRKYYLNSLPKYQHFLEMSKTFDKVDHLGKGHPLENLQKAI